jgi:myo-inositol-1(or 4)-monophosphatase
MKRNVLETDPSLEELASFANELALAARRETLRLSPHERRADDKASDGLFDPVTEADRAAETVIRQLIARRFPDHGIAGEELPDKPANGPFAWSIDPIDGTRSYICGLPNWTTLIAFLNDGKPVIGLIDAPSLDETYVGMGTEAALLRAGERSRIGTSGCVRIAEARFSTTDPNLFSGAAADALNRLRSTARTARFGHDGYAYARLAAGTLDLVVECGLKPHDYHALIPVVRGAGGVFGDWRGGTDFAAGNVIAAATPGLYEAAVAIMQDAA